MSEIDVPVMVAHSSKLFEHENHIVYTKLADFEDMRKPNVELVWLSLVKENDRLYIRPAYIIHKEEKVDGS